MCPMSPSLFTEWKNSEVFVSDGMTGAREDIKKILNLQGYIGYLGLIDNTLTDNSSTSIVSVEDFFKADKQSLPLV